MGMGMGMGLGMRAVPARLSGVVNNARLLTADHISSR
jgi:hypothetical protein